MLVSSSPSLVKESTLEYRWMVEKELWSSGEEDIVFKSDIDQLCTSNGQEARFAYEIFIKKTTWKDQVNIIMWFGEYSYLNF